MPLSHLAQAALPTGRSQTPGPVGRGLAVVACQLTAVPQPIFGVDQSIGEGVQPEPKTKSINEDPVSPSHVAPPKSAEVAVV